MPKGDAEKLRADIDDGYARISWLLLEALSCAPLTDYEHSVVWFVARLTYGWAQAGDRDSGKLAPTTAAEISRATNHPRRTIEKAIARLVKANVLIKQTISQDNRAAYGINPDVAEWGLPDATWRSWYTCLQRNREDDTYTPSSVHLYAEQRTPIRQPEDRYTPASVYSPPTNPRAPGVSEPPTTSLTTSLTENVNDLAIPAECATLDSQAEDPCEGQGTPTHKARSETPEQAAIHRLWDAFELPGKPSPEKGEKPGYSSVLLLVQTHGIPLLDQLSAHVQADPTARLPDGAKPWPWFCKTARAYLGAPWKWDGTGNGNGDARKAKPREEFILTRWGKRYPASEWSPGEANHVAWMKAEDNWDPETGRTLRPVPTFCCVDGYFYPGDGSERFEVAPV